MSRMFVDYPEWAALCGVYPKTDQSHGFPNPLSYEMYRDFQENTLNSDVNNKSGVIINRVGSVWLFYIWPLSTAHMLFTTTCCLTTGCNSNWNRLNFSSSSVKNGENARLRMKDAIATTVLEELYGMQ